MRCSLGISQIRRAISLVTISLILPCSITECLKPKSSAIAEAKRASRSRNPFCRTFTVKDEKSYHDQSARPGFVCYRGRYSAAAGVYRPTVPGNVTSIVENSPRHRSKLLINRALAVWQTVEIKPVRLESPDLDAQILTPAGTRNTSFVRLLSAAIKPLWIVLRHAIRSGTSPCTARKRGLDEKSRKPFQLR